MPAVRGITPPPADAAVVKHLQLLLTCLCCLLAGLRMHRSTRHCPLLVLGLLLVLLIVSVLHYWLSKLLQMLLVGSCCPASIETVFNSSEHTTFTTAILQTHAHAHQVSPHHS